MTDQTTAEATAAAIPTGGRQRAFAEFWHYYSMNTGAVIGLVVFAALV
ncbi:MAG: dipeptide ABC transporter permease DppC, partial [Mesorhizobium sp.]